MVSTWEKSVYDAGMLELMGYRRISGKGMEPYHHRVGLEAPPPSLAGLYRPRVALALRAAQPSLYQGQQGDVNQPVHGNYKSRF